MYERVAVIVAAQKLILLGALVDVSLAIAFIGLGIVIAAASSTIPGKT